MTTFCRQTEHKLLTFLVSSEWFEIKFKWSTASVHFLNRKFQFNNPFATTKFSSVTKLVSRKIKFKNSMRNDWWVRAILPGAAVTELSMLAIYYSIDRCLASSTHSHNVDVVVKFSWPLCSMRRLPLFGCCWFSFNQFLLNYFLFKFHRDCIESNVSMSASNSKHILIESSELVGPSEYSSEFVQLTIVCEMCPYVCLGALFANGLLNVQKWYRRRRRFYLSFPFHSHAATQDIYTKHIYHNCHAHTIACVLVESLTERAHIILCALKTTTKKVVWIF